MGKKQTQYNWLVQAIATHKSNDCLLWPFKVDEDGYGRLSFEIKTVGAHRLAFKIANGHWPMPYCLHQCDTPRCVNPLHLWEGTDADNHADQVRKGRTTKGTQQPQAKLTEEIVSKVREIYSHGSVTMRALAQRYGVSRPTIEHAIRGGRNWKHVPNPVGTEKIRRFHKMYCRHGHLLSEDNCYVYQGKRQCKICTTLRSKRRKKRMQEERAESRMLVTLAG
jgi:hypothetical protein